MWGAIASIATSFLSSGSGQNAIGGLLDGVLGGGGGGGILGGLLGGDGGGLLGGLFGGGKEEEPAGLSGLSGGIAGLNGMGGSSLMGNAYGAQNGMGMGMPCMHSMCFPMENNPYGMNGGMFDMFNRPGMDMNMPYGPQASMQQFMQPGSAQMEQMLDKLIDSLMERLASRGMDL